VVRVDHEEVVEEVDEIVLFEIVGREMGDPKVAVLPAAVDVLLELEEQAGHQIDRGVNLRHLGQKSRHAPIVLGAVEADPGHGVLAGNIIGVVGLMLVPEEGQGDVVHHSLSGGVRS
jgi:hypothetical protein